MNDLEEFEMTDTEMAYGEGYVKGMQDVQDELKACEHKLEQARQALKRIASIEANRTMIATWRVLASESIDIARAALKEKS